MSRKRDETSRNVRDRSTQAPTNLLSSRVDTEMSSRTDLYDDVVDVPSFSALDVVENVDTEIGLQTELLIADRLEDEV